MSILVNKKTKVLVQGMTGRTGRFHTDLMKKYGTKIAAGVTPGRGGKHVCGFKVYNKVSAAVKKNNLGDDDFSILFVPAPHVKEAATEALENNLNLVIISENVPVLDTIEFLKIAKKRNKIVIGPNCPGIISPDESLVGILPQNVFKKGNIGIVSRSGSLTYEISNELSRAGFGQSTVVGIGGDPVIGTIFNKTLNLFEKDKATKAVVVVGEIGGDLEERAAAYIKKNITKPVFGFIAGMFAPPGKRMGHAGAIISTSAGTPSAKVAALEKANVKVAKLPSEIVGFVRGLK